MTRVPARPADDSPALLRPGALCRRRRARRARRGPSSTRRIAGQRAWWRTRWPRWRGVARLPSHAGGAGARRHAVRAPTCRASRRAGWVARCGGATRARHRGQRPGRAARQRGARADDWVLVHDAARCLVRPEWVDALIDACLDDAGRRPAGAAGGRHAEAGRRDGRVAATLDRGDKWPAQTPQMFRLGLLREALARGRRRRHRRSQRDRSAGPRAAAGARRAARTSR